MVIVCIVGNIDSDSNSRFCAQAVEALEDIPVRMISYGGSNYNISMLIRACDKQRALNKLNEHLFEHNHG